MTLIDWPVENLTAPLATAAPLQNADIIPPSTPTACKLMIGNVSASFNIPVWTALCRTQPFHGDLAQVLVRSSFASCLWVSILAGSILVVTQADSLTAVRDASETPKCYPAAPAARYLYARPGLALC